MYWGLHYIVQDIKHKTFEDLATHACDMELSIVIAENQNLLLQEQSIVIKAKFVLKSIMNSHWL